jgi:hypothetical protein
MKNLFLKSTVLPYAIILAVLLFTYRIYVGGDTVALLSGLGVALSCLSDTPMKIPCGAGVVHFPIFQYLVGAPFKEIGLSNDVILNIFGKMSVVWSVISAWVFWRVGYISSGRAGGHLSVLVLLSGYLLWYMTSSFNEAAAFALFALLAFSVIDKWRIALVCILALSCTITKEIAFPFVVYFMLLSFFAREMRGGATTTLFRHILQFVAEYKVAILCAVAGIGVNLAFNYFRFETIDNVNNLNPILFNPWEYVPTFFAYLFMSPAGGLVFIWLSLSTLLIVPAIFLIRDRAALWIIFFTLLALIFANLGLARWFSSFGWNAWGPRLSLPFLGSIGVLIVYVTMPYVTNYLKRIGKTKGLAIIFLVTAASSLPNITVRLDDGAFFAKMYAPAKVAIDSGIPVFTVQSAPAPLYQKAAIEGYARNIIIPTSLHIAKNRWVITLLWLMALFLISRQVLLPAPNINTNKILGTHSNPLLIALLGMRNAMMKWSDKTQKIVIVLIALFLLIISTTFTMAFRGTCPSCLYLIQKTGMVGNIANYQFFPAHENLTKTLDGFPPSLPMVEIQVLLSESKNLDAINVLAPNGLGNWTSLPIQNTWGIAVVDKVGDEYKVRNEGQRVGKMNLSHGGKLYLWFPDNGGLSKCPELQVELVFNDGTHSTTVATCNLASR